MINNRCIIFVKFAFNNLWQGKREKLIFKNGYFEISRILFYGRVPD